jgi:acetylornithine deacetylase/succinyl-diaminopimelate desuccinylase-like protein
LRLTITTIGKSVHSGGHAWNDGDDGINAVTGLASILLKLESINIASVPHKSFGTLRNIITPGTIVNGGEFESMVPNKASAIVDIRLLPGTDSSAILEQIESLLIEETQLRPGLQCNLSVKNNLPAVMIDESHPLVTITIDIAQRITRKNWKAIGAGPANEGYMLINSGIPTLCGFGPKGDNAHGANEWVEINSLTQTTAIYAAVAEKYLIEIQN